MTTDRKALNMTARKTAHLEVAQRIDPLLRRADVLKVTGLSQSALYRLIRSDHFPQPVSVTDATVAWKQSEIITWIDARPRVAS